MISEANLFPHYKSMEANDPWGMTNLYSMGMVCRIKLQGGGGTRHCYILTMYAVGLMVSGKFNSPGADFCTGLSF